MGRGVSFRFFFFKGGLGIQGGGELKDPNPPPPYQKKNNLKLTPLPKKTYNFWTNVKSVGLKSTTMKSLCSIVFPFRYKE